ncbi:MAG: hypothetical protein KAS16_08415 [Thermoplasmata archaeon]|nr:hypothetical protein [Thermoplasmata archaeon]
MDTVDWLIIISVIVFICLGIWGIRFPRSGSDWKKSREETVSTVFSLMLFLAFFLLLWYVMGVIDWPDAMNMTMWISAIIFVALILAAIFLPTGTRLKLGKKDKSVKTADDDDD